MLVERIAPDTALVLVDGKAIELPVVRTIVHPPGQHAGPIKAETAALELVTDCGSRWWGIERGWIASDLAVHVIVDDMCELRRAWRKP